MAGTQALMELEALIQKEGNGVCADCRRPNPEWTSLNLGIFLCIECSGIHRNLGSHVSKVKSVKLDQWTTDQLKQMQDIGNLEAAKRWEQNVPATYKRPTSKDDPVLREQWIRAKYERREFVEGEEAKMLRETYLSGQKEGFLSKKGKDNNRWAKRWVMLSGDNIVYFIHEKDVPSNPKDTLPLLATTFTVCANKINRPYALQFSYNRRNYFFSADDGHQLVDWINAIRAAQAKVMGLEDATPQEAAKILEQLDHGFTAEGWLTKQGPKEKGWKKRYFTLQDTLLLYYKTPADATCLGYIQLGKKEQGFSVEENSKPPVGFCFTLNTPARAYSLQAEDKDSVKKWMEAFQLTIEKASTRDSVTLDIKDED